MKKKRFLWIALSVLLVSAVIFGIVFLKNSKKKSDKAINASQDETNAVTIADPEKNETDNEAEIQDDGTALTLSEPEASVPDNRTGETAEPSAEAKQPVFEAEAATSDTTVTDKNYVQDANPETGISWDGKSAIIYRYADGAETTEKRYGGYYEIRPNEWVLYARSLEKEEENNQCSHCGKTMGDGTNGTCVRWMMGDMTCPNCGEFVPANTCHTCGE